MRTSLLLLTPARSWWWRVVVVVVVVGLLKARLSDQAAIRSSATASSSSLFSASADVVKLDLGELRKLGVGADDLLRHIRLLVDGRVGDCIDRASAGSPSPARVRPSPAANSAAAVTPEDEDLRRQFVRNKTVTCNDGSKAGYSPLHRISFA